MHILRWGPAREDRLVFQLASFKKDAARCIKYFEVTCSTQGMSGLLEGYLLYLYKLYHPHRA
jgi:hypothetical protein